MAKRQSLVSELFRFIRENRTYWIAPIVVLLLMVGVLIIVGGSKIAPFIYTLF